MLTTEDVKLMLEIQLKAYKDSTQMLLNDLMERLRQVESRNKELVHSLEFTQKEVDTLKSGNTVLREELNMLKKDMSKQAEVQVKVDKLMEKMNYQEDYSRRNNLRVDGLEEQANETWEVTQDKVQRLIRDKLELGPIEVERAHRVGPRTDSNTGRPRTTIVRFVKFEDRQLVLRNSPKLKKTNIFINEDLCEASMQERRAKLPELKKARAEGKIAYFSHTRLVIKERKVHSALVHDQRSELRRADGGDAARDGTASARDVVVTRSAAAAVGACGGAGVDAGDASASGGSGGGAAAPAVGGDGAAAAALGAVGGAAAPDGEGEGFVVVAESATGTTMRPAGGGTPRGGGSGMKLRGSKSRGKK